MDYIVISSSNLKVTFAFCVYFSDYITAHQHQLCQQVPASATFPPRWPQVQQNMHILHFFTYMFKIWMLSLWICSSLFASAPEGSSEQVPCSPAALHSSPESVTETNSLKTRSPSTSFRCRFKPPIFVSLCHLVFILQIYQNCLNLQAWCLQPAQLCAPPGPCDLGACPPFWHSPGCGPPDRRSKWTPGKVSRSARKGAAELCVTANDNKHISAWV